MITSTNLNALRNLEHFQVMSNVLSYLKEENLEELKLSAFAESFEKQLKVYDEVLVLERGNVLSLKLTDADKKRDDAYRALAGIVKAYTVFPEEEKADAALKLLHVIGKYGKGIDRLIKMIKSITPQKRQDGRSAKILLMAPPHLGDDLTEIPSGEEMGFERGISYSKRLAPIYEDWAKFHNIEFLDAAKYAKASEIDACHLTRESHRKLGEMVAKKCKEILEI